MSTSRHLWSESHCREKLLPVLGVDATQKVRRLGGCGRQALLTGPGIIPAGEKRFILAQILATSAYGELFPFLWACGEMVSQKKTVIVGRQGQRQDTASRTHLQ